MPNQSSAKPHTRRNHYRAKWLAEGKCVNCGKTERAILSLQCQTCLDGHKRRNARYRGKLAIERIRRRYAWFHPQRAKQKFPQQQNQNNQPAT